MASAPKRRKAAGTVKAPAATGPAPLPADPRLAHTHKVVVYRGRQYHPGDLPAGVDASTLPTLAEWRKAS